jgi:hypothetical protein
MFGSNVLEVAIGVVFAFLSVSLASGTIVEGLSSIIQWRAQTLRKGVKDLFNDAKFTGLAEELYNHASINPRGSGDKPEKKKPSYINPQLMAGALMDILGITEKIEATPKNGDTTAFQARQVTAFKGAINTKLTSEKTKNPQLQQLLDGVIARANGDATKIKSEIALWFDQGMAQVSGIYKRHAQIASVLVALGLAVGLNVDTFNIAIRLWEQPTLAQSIQVQKDQKPAEAIKELTDRLPTGWPAGFGNRADGTPFTCGDWWRAIAGWCATAIAALFGAPFWFDLLQNLVRLRGTGPKEEQTQTGDAA